MGFIFGKKSGCLGTIFLIIFFGILIYTFILKWKSAKYV